MMPLELTKAEKKTAREIIERGLRREMEANLQELHTLLSRWKENGSDVKETYHKVFGKVTDFDKHIARRYDDLSGSQYLLCILGQYRDGVITAEDLTGLLPETTAVIKRWKNG